MNIPYMTGLEAARKIKNKEISARELLDEIYKNIDEREGDINAYVTLSKEEAYETAKLVDEGKITGRLAGVPIAVKDNICTKGIKTTCSSKILENFVPGYDAEVITRLKAEGAIIVGKTNMDEFAMGSTTETSYFKPTKNPRNTEYVPGGSSGGSAAAVAAGECFMSLGSDTGGSIRQPAGYCGVVGLKPTYSTVSRYGLIAYGSSLDQIGTLANNTEDAAALLDVIASYDKKDSTSAKNINRDFSRFIKEADETGIKGLKIGIPKEYFAEGLDDEVRGKVLEGVKVLEEAGAIVEEFSLGLVEYAIPAYYTIAAAEASSNLERFDGIKYGYRTEKYTDLHNLYKKTRSEGFGSEVKRRIMLGSFVLSSGYYDAYYLKALRVKKLIKDEFNRAFEKYDVIVSPTSPTTAPKIGESLADPIKMYLGDIYTVSINLAGLPGISIPCGSDKSDLPIGMQLIGDCYKEGNIIKAARCYENAVRCDKNSAVSNNNEEMYSNNEEMYSNNAEMCSNNEEMYSNNAEMCSNNEVKEVE